MFCLCGAALFCCLGLNAEGALLLNVLDVDELDLLQSVRVPSAVICVHLGWMAGRVLARQLFVDIDRAAAHQKG